MYVTLQCLTFARVRINDTRYLTGTIRHLHFSLEGKFLSACSSNCTVHIFDMRPHKKKERDNTTNSIIQHDRCFARARLHSIPISCTFLSDTTRTRSTTHFFIITENGRYLQHAFNRELGGECVRVDDDSVGFVFKYTDESEEGFVEVV